MPNWETWNLELRLIQINSDERGWIPAHGYERRTCQRV